MKLRALHTVKTGGKIYAPGAILPKLSKKDAVFLVQNGSAVEEGAGDRVSEYDGELLFQNIEDFGTLKVDELKAICLYMELPVSGNKSELIQAIEAASELEEIDDDETAEPETLVPDSE